MHHRNSHTISHNVNTGLESRALRFKKCETLLSPLDWVLEFGSVFRFAPEYCPDIIDDPRLNDSVNWKLRAQLEFLSAVGRFDEAIELCEEAIESIDDRRVSTQLLCVRHVGVDRYARTRATIETEVAPQPNTEILGRGSFICLFSQTLAHNAG